MSKIPLLGTGLNGLVGSKFVADFGDIYDFTNLDLRHSQQPTDITNQQQVYTALNNSSAKFVVHMAAYTDVTGAFQQTGDQTAPCYQINVKGTENLVRACNATDKHLIHLSTAYVFDGEKKEAYKETDSTNPIEWYGQTKALAEEVVMKDAKTWTILRIDQPFRNDIFPKVDTLHRIIEGMRSDQLHPQFTDHHFGPTYINDFVKIIDLVIRQRMIGLYHASSGESWTDYEFAKAVNNILQLDFEVRRGSLAKYLKTSRRPYQKNTALNIDKLKKFLDFKPRSIKQAIGETIL